MRTILFRTGQLALSLSLAPAAFAQPTPAATPVYGPKLEPAAFAPQQVSPGEPERKPTFLVKFFKKLTPYEQSLSDWKGRQYSCMKRGSLCLEARPLPSDLLRAPSAR